MSKIYTLFTLLFIVSSSTAVAADLTCSSVRGPERELAALRTLASQSLKSDGAVILTRNQMDDICSAILNKTPPTAIGVGISYAYQEKLWIFSGQTPVPYIRTPNATPEQRKADRKTMEDIMTAAQPKIQAMWKANRAKFTCSNTSNLANGKNIMKYVLESGFTSFLTDSRYALDANFIDPIDGVSIIDYIEARKKQIASIDPDKYSEFDGIQQALRARAGL